MSQTSQCIQGSRLWSPVTTTGQESGRATTPEATRATIRHRRERDVVRRAPAGESRRSVPAALASREDSGGAFRQVEWRGAFRQVEWQGGPGSPFRRFPVGGSLARLPVLEQVGLETLERLDDDVPGDREERNPGKELVDVEL